MSTRSDRPTTPPPYDVAQFAKDTDARVKTARAPRLDQRSTLPEMPSSETRLATRPCMGGLTDEAWGRGMVGTPIVVMTPETLRRLPLDHRAGFLLSLMDGTIDLETVIELSTMRKCDALRLARDMYEAGVITFR